MEEKHFFVVHTFVSDEVRSQFVTPPEKRETEKEWVEKIQGKYARCVQTWVGNEEFFYCHWIAKSEQDVRLPRANKTFTDNSTNSTLVLTD